MAKNITKLTENENKFFHLNYDYMWKKLNTAPYYVSGTGECPLWIKNTEVLPSYVNLSKCRNHDFIPSIMIVNKIVNFYNSNISPEITAFQFLTEDLSLTDANRTKNIELVDNRFLGTYYGYYYNDSDIKQVVGIIIKIYEENQMLCAVAISGINTDEQLYGTTLKNLFEQDNITFDSYKQYFNSLDISLQRTTFYQGYVSIAQRFLMIYLGGIDKEQKKLFINLSTENFINNDKYLCGTSFSTLISDKFDIQFFKLAILRANRDDIIPMSLKDEKLTEVLSMTKLENEHITLTPRDEQKWYEFVVQNGK